MSVVEKNPQPAVKEKTKPIVKPSFLRGVLLGLAACIAQFLALAITDANVRAELKKGHLWSALTHSNTMMVAAFLVTAAALLCEYHEKWCGKPVSVPPSSESEPGVSSHLSNNKLIRKVSAAIEAQYHRHFRRTAFSALSLFFVWGVINGLMFSSIKADTKLLPGMKQDLQHIVRMLEEELRVKNAQIEFLQGMLKDAPTPSPRAQELAKQIPDNADPYALALKAIAERRFEDAERFLDKAQAQKEKELADIYIARGDTNYYAGKYEQAIPWYRKAHALHSDNPAITNSLGLAFLASARFKEAEPLFQQALAIRQKVLPEGHPDIANSLSSLAGLYENQDRYPEAEPLYQQALTILQKALGPEHPHTKLVAKNYRLFREKWEKSKKK